jgi:hypothetical protein
LLEQFDGLEEVTMDAVPDAWTAYRDTTPDAFAATLSAGDEPRQEHEQAVDDLLTRSDALRDAILPHLGGETADEREMAALQLQAAAAIDLDRANSLAGMDEGGAREATLSAEHLDVLDRILSTPTQQGISSVLDLAEGGFAATASEPPPLNDTVGAAIDNIVKDAEKAAGTTVRGIVGFADLELVAHVNAGVQSAFSQLNEKLSWLKKRALALVLRAVEKLLAVFGAKTGAAQKMIAGWAGELEEGKAVAFLQGLYKIEDLKKDYSSRIAGHTGAISEARAQAARDELASLEKRWHLRTQIIDTLGGLAGYARAWILALSPPLGAVAYATGFVTATGYVVLAGGDYLDWREGESVLNLVEGVGAVVNRATAP